MKITPKKSSESTRALLLEIVLDDQTHHSAIVKWFDARTGKVEVPADASAQLAQLKRQLADLGKTVENLEAVITPPPAPPAEEKKPQEKMPEDGPKKE